MLLNKILKKHETSGIIIITLLIVIIGTIFYKEVEHWTWLNSIYFSVMTLTTIGYGDLTIKQDISKIFTIFYSIIGIGMFLTFMSVINRNTVEKLKGDSDNIYDQKYNLLRKKKNKYQ